MSGAAVQMLRARPEQAEGVADLVRDTIAAVYPHYYPAGAVRFFLDHHHPAAIGEDIARGWVYLAVRQGAPVGTVTVRGAEICRLFVRPEDQGLGLGVQLMDWAEARVFADFDRAWLDASLPAQAWYARRGYRADGYERIAAGKDFLCYCRMYRPRP